MYPLEVVDHGDGFAPSRKRSCPIGDPINLLRDNEQFFAFGNDLYERGLFCPDTNTPTINLAPTCFANECGAPYQQLATPRCDDDLGMPYISVQPTVVPKYPLYSCSESSASVEDSDEKDMSLSSLCIKKDCDLKGMLKEPLLTLSGSIYPDTVFCKVPSRTALQKPKVLTVTVGEVYRRVFGPEMMNVSLLGSYLRRAKEKDGGKTLRDELTKIGMCVPLGRRKNGSTTTWTCFVEEETQTMALDLDIASRKFFPVQDFAQAIRERLNVSDEEVRTDFVSMRRILKVMRQIFSEDRSPVHGREVGETVLNKELQDGLYRYSCATHGFGSLALMSSIDLFNALMEAVLELIGFGSEDGSSSSSIDSI